MVLSGSSKYGNGHKNGTVRNASKPIRSQAAAVWKNDGADEQYHSKNLKVNKKHPDGMTDDTEKQ